MAVAKEVYKRRVHVHWKHSCPTPRSLSPHETNTSHQFAATSPYHFEQDCKIAGFFFLNCVAWGPAQFMFCSWHFFLVLMISITHTPTGLYSLREERGWQRLNRGRGRKVVGPESLEVICLNTHETRRTGRGG